MKYFITILILLISIPANAFKIKRIDPYANIEFKTIDILYCSKMNITLHFDKKGQYRKYNVMLLSPIGNGLIKIDYPKNIFADRYVKLIKGVETSLLMKIIAFDGEIDISIYDVYSKQFLSVIKLRGIIPSNFDQRTTVYGDNDSTRVYHNIRYKDWSFNLGVQDDRKNGTVKPNFSITKKW